MTVKLVSIPVQCAPNRLLHVTRHELTGKAVAISAAALHSLPGQQDKITHNHVSSQYLVVPHEVDLVYLQVAEVLLRLRRCRRTQTCS